MAEHLKTYHAELVTCSPVFIGDGGSMDKRTYLKRGNMVFIPELQKMYQGLKKRNLAAKFEDYLLEEHTMGLNQWMIQNKVPKEVYSPWMRYSLDAGDIESDSHMEIKTFIKDPYGCPYVPGSSIKGMLRTVLLSYELIKNKEKYRSERENIFREAQVSRGKRNYLLKKETDGLENKVFHTLSRLNAKPRDVENAVNDFMSGIHISDSMPLSTKDLVLCQKLDVSVNGKWKGLNLMRECIRPGVKIQFTITVDDRFPYSKEEIKEAIKAFGTRYFFGFYNKFKLDKNLLTPPRTNYVWLGGGAGFVSKTVIYPLMGKEINSETNHEKAVDTAAEILIKTVNISKHDHKGDGARNISPHMLKCTKYKGKLYEFGQCAFRFV